MRKFVFGKCLVCLCPSKWEKRMRRWMFIFASLVFILILVDYFCFQMFIHNRTLNLSFSELNGQHVKYVVDTPGCKIPETREDERGLEWSWLDLWRDSSKEPDCSGAGVVHQFDDLTQMLALGSGFRGENCNLYEVNHGFRAEKEWFRLSMPQPLNDPIPMNNTELFISQCGRYLNAEAHFPLKPAVREKIRHWADPKTGNGRKLEHAILKEPINVIMIGFDSCSRHHFHESLPKTMKLFRDMDFLEFKGYHSVLPYTLENFLAFLLGKEGWEVRKVCAPDWSSTFDKCPSAFKYFGENQYVTLYGEDGSQTFNWGGQGGFSTPPADYYLHPMFRAVSELRQRNYSQFGVNHICVNQQNPQTYLFNYVRRFLKQQEKYTQVPFFAFTWNNDATHDSRATLSGMDQDFATLLDALLTRREILEKTLVIVISDHGYRFDDVTSIDNSGAFIQRSLPGLFIRIPQVLRDHANFARNMKGNTNKLITGFDVHHTLLHLLVLAGMEFTTQNFNSDTNKTETAVVTPSNFQVTRPDRSSLFAPISNARNCSSLHIREANCVCGVTSKVQAWENPYVRTKLVKFAIDELNDLIRFSRYFWSCRTFTAPMLPFVSGSILKHSGTVTDGILRFETREETSVFDVHLRVHHKLTVLDKVERTSNFMRISRYGDLSWCVGHETDEDKYYKELCNCKSKKPD